MLAMWCLMAVGAGSNADLVIRAFPDSPTKLTATNCLRLRPGMTRLQVAALVAGKGRLIECGNFGRPWPNPAAWSFLGIWKSDQIELTVWFNADGKLTEAFFEWRPSGELVVIPELYKKP